MSLAQARAVADAVLYEGYLLYPYRSSSQKNQLRWQFGVLGPPGASIRGLGEPAGLSAECVIRADDASTVSVYLRFLQLQTREVERLDADALGGFVPAQELVTDGATWVTWEEAAEHEVELGPFSLAALDTPSATTVDVECGDEEEPLIDRTGRLVGRNRRRRWPMQAQLELATVEVGNGMRRLRVAITNTSTTAIGDKDEAIRTSFIGAHALLVAHDAEFVSMLDPPELARAATQSCVQRRCFPVLAGSVEDRGIMLLSPIILYDHPELAPQSAGALYDSTEIDEILSLRVMTMTDGEKAEARATDPRAAAIIERCEALPAEALQAMHGILRDPHAPFGDATTTAFDDLPTFGATDMGTANSQNSAPWWDPGADERVSPDTETVIVAGVAVSKGSVVTLHPKRRADAQDLFFDGQTARVTGVLFDVDGDTHVAVVLTDDPAADLHEWYGRYLYFNPDEVEPLVRESDTTLTRKEN